MATLPGDVDVTRSLDHVSPLGSASLERAGGFAHLAAINPLVAAANPILMIVATVGKAGIPLSIESFRADLRKLIRTFESNCRAQAKSYAMSEEQIQAAKYALCTVLDESIQRCAWSHTTDWAVHPLLEHFFGEVKGGETFFEILEASKQGPKDNLWLLQLQYICLSLGYMGKFLASDSMGKHRVAELRERLFDDVIRASIAGGSNVLSANAAGKAVGTRHMRGFTAFWLSIAAVMLACVIAFVSIYLSLGEAFDKVGTSRLQLAAANPVASPQAATRWSTIVQRLRDEQIEVLERGSAPVIRISGGIFDSGSATPRSDSLVLLSRIAEILDTGDYRLEVTGFTDNEPVRTASYPNNYALSLARAQAVSELLQERIRNRNRVMTPRGAGDSDPIVRNDSAANRAMNRRVEIVLRPVAGS